MPVLNEAASTSKTDGPAEAFNILVVEDHADARFLVCEMLDILGHRCTAAADAEQAQALLAQGDFDVLFTDINLPGMSGVELARHALITRPALKIVFASGHGGTLGQYVEFAATTLAKPYDLLQLEKALANLPPQK